MQMETVTTPFGRRAMTIELLRRQTAAARIKPGKTADKWKVFRDASAAMDKLGIQSNSLAVLNALLSFYPENVLRQDARLIVFPSNVQLALRAHGMASATIRRHISALVEAGLIVRRDSANGKRYARKGKMGDIETAYGFDISPLLERSEELEMLAQQVLEERSKFKKAKESLTICRRDVRKLISAALEELAPGDWVAVETLYIALVSRIPRSPTPADVEALLNEMQILRQEILNRLAAQCFSQNLSTNAAHNEQHIHESKTESLIELEQSSRKEQGAISRANTHPSREQMKAYPLEMVLKACTLIKDYGPGGQIRNRQDLMSAAVVVRSMLGVTPSAYQDACETMGQENAATAIACILERANFINSAGGYLRDLTQRAARDEFSLGPMIMALLRTNLLAQKRTG